MGKTHLIPLNLSHKWLIFWACFILLGSSFISSSAPFLLSVLWFFFYLSKNCYYNLFYSQLELNQVFFPIEVLRSEENSVPLLELSEITQLNVITYPGFFWQVLRSEEDSVSCRFCSNCSLLYYSYREPEIGEIVLK